MPEKLPALARVLVLSLGALIAGCGGDNGPREPENVTLHVAGRVTDREDGDPLPGVIVGVWRFLSDAPPVGRTTTDDAGHYELSTLIERCVDGAFYLSVITENLNFCYYLGSVRSLACTESPQTIDLPLHRELGREGCPWTSGQVAIRSDP